MEESISLLTKLKKEFVCAEVDINTYSPLTLAYIGDCIYDLMIRTVVVERGNRAASGLHKSVTAYVNATTQSSMAESLLGTFTQEEEAVYRRGRNAKSYTSAKNASISDYRRATGLEALFGYLYLRDDTDRLLFLVKEGLKKIEMEI